MGLVPPCTALRGAEPAPALSLPTPRKAQSHSPGSQIWASHPESVLLWEMNRCGDRFVPCGCKTCQVWGSWSSPEAGAGTGLLWDTSQPSSFLLLSQGKIKLGLSPGAVTSCRQEPHTGDSTGGAGSPPEAEQDTHRDPK